MLEAALLAAVFTARDCKWADPGHNPYRGSVAAAINDYKFIPETTRKKLVERADKRIDYDMVEITSTSIISSHGVLYEPTMYGMHSGDGSICGEVSRGWADTVLERGLVYCEDEYCILIPTVCRNVSFIYRRPPVAPPPPIEIPPEAPPIGLVPPVLTLLPPSETFETPTERPPVTAFSGPGYPSTSFFYGGYGGTSYCVCCDTPGAIAAIPEPSTYALMFLGLAGIAWRSKRCRQEEFGRVN